MPVEFQTGSNLERAIGRLEKSPMDLLSARII